jgi:hypothetical protein
LIPTHFADANKGQAVKGFLAWMLADGQSYNESLSYAKLPPAVVAKEKKALSQIQ